MPDNSPVPTPAKDPDQIYYGWKIVAALLVILSFSSGLSFYNHAIYLNALATQSAFDVSSASLAVSVFFLSGGVAGLWVAKWIQDYDPRYCISAGATMCFLSLSVLGQVSTLWQLFAVYAFFGVGFTASSLIPATTLVARWFHRRRAMALSIASTGLSVGGVIITPLSVLLVDSLGFVSAMPVLGVMYLLGVIPAAWLFLRPSPESMGLIIDGVKDESRQLNNDPRPEPLDSSSSDGQVHHSEDGFTYKEAKGSRFFWGVSLAYICLMMAQVGGIAHQFGLARELLSEAETAVVVAILPVGSIVGRLIGGWLIGRVSIRKFAIVMMMMQSLSLLLLSTGFSIVTLCLGLALFGSSVGNLLMLQPLLIAESFGVRDYAKIFSVSNLMSSWGTAIGPALLGFVYAANANLYSLPYQVAALAGFLGLLLFLAGGKMQAQFS